MPAGRFPLIRPPVTFSPTGGEGRDEGALAISGRVQILNFAEVSICRKPVKTGQRPLSVGEGLITVKE